jgi:hypothetical protein
VEAIAMLGVVKYVAPGRGDQRHARNLIEGYSNSDDPIIAAAAKAADTLTVEQLRLLGSGGY